MENDVEVLDLVKVVQNHILSRLAAQSLISDNSCSPLVSEAGLTVNEKRLSGGEAERLAAGTVVIQPLGVEEPLIGLVDPESPVGPADTDRGTIFSEE